jgi:hypothetical protein
MASIWSGRRAAGGEGLPDCVGVSGLLCRFGRGLLLLLVDVVEERRLGRVLRLFRLLVLRERFLVLLPLDFAVFAACLEPE